MACKKVATQGVVRPSRLEFSQAPCSMSRIGWKRVSSGIGHLQLESMERRGEDATKAVSGNQGLFEDVGGSVGGWRPRFADVPEQVTCATDGDAGYGVLDRMIDRRIINHYARPHGSTCQVDGNNTRITLDLEIRLGLLFGSDGSQRVSASSPVRKSDTTREGGPCSVVFHVDDRGTIICRHI